MLTINSLLKSIQMPRAKNGSKKGRYSRRVTALDNLTVQIDTAKEGQYNKHQMKRMLREQATLQSRV